MKPRLKPSKQAEEMYRLWQKRNEEEMPVKAFSTLVEAARLGSEEAQVALAYNYAYGVIGNANEKRALQLWSGRTGEGLGMLPSIWGCGT